MDASRNKPFILSLFTSPGASSLSDSIHESFLSRIPSETVIKRVKLKELTIAPCTGCGGCTAGKPCVFHDDMEELYLDLETCMALTISLPLYFSGVPAGLKALIDRGEYLWQRKRAGHRARERSAAVIITAGSDYPDMFDGALQCLRHFLSTVNVRIDAAHSLLVRNTDAGNRPDDGIIRAAAEGFYRGSSL